MDEILGIGVGSYTSEGFGLLQPQPPILVVRRVLMSLDLLLKDINNMLIITHRRKRYICGKV